MKLTVAWNVWSNYQDTLLASEIARLSNQEKKHFDDLYLISQGGYPIPPSKEEMLYMDTHLDVAIREDHPLIHCHPKFKGVFRVLNGIRQAYEIALARGSDFALVTNGDAWCLDLSKLSALLHRSDIQNSAVSTRVGVVACLDSNFGAWVPFFDDHFIILNVASCKHHGIFDYEEPKAYHAHFVDYGGIHYMLGALLDERVPDGLFNAYTHLQDCVNHFGEKSGFSLLPWQYQPEHAFLHANCAQEPDLHTLRAAMLQLHGLNRFPEVSNYCNKHSNEADNIEAINDFVFYQQSVLSKTRMLGKLVPYRIYLAFLRKFRYARFSRLKSELLGQRENTLDYFDSYSDILPLALSSRRRPM